jgi:hypothetical protein
MLTWQVVSSQWSVERHAAERDDRSPAGYRDHEQLIEETARVRRIWRMLMLEECGLRLFGNSASGMRGGLCGRRRGGVVAPMAMRGSMALIVSDCPVAANGAVVRNYLNVSNPRMMSAVDLLKLRVSYSDPEAMGSNRRRKRARNKATVGMRKVLFDRRNNMADKGLSAPCRTRRVKPKPTSAVASRASRLDERPVAMSGAGEEHRRHESGALGRVARSKPIRRPRKRIIDGSLKDLVCCVRNG